MEGGGEARGEVEGEGGEGCKSKVMAISVIDDFVF